MLLGQPCNKSNIPVKLVTSYDKYQHVHLSSLNQPGSLLFIDWTSRPCTDTSQKFNIFRVFCAIPTLFPRIGREQNIARVSPDSIDWLLLHVGFLDGCQLSPMRISNSFNLVAIPSPGKSEYILNAHY